MKTRMKINRIENRKQHKRLMKPEAEIFFRQTNHTGSIKKRVDTNYQDQKLVM